MEFALLGGIFVSLVLASAGRFALAWVVYGALQPPHAANFLNAVAFGWLLANIPVFTNLINDAESSKARGRVLYALVTGIISIGFVLAFGHNSNVVNYFKPGWDSVGLFLTLHILIALGHHVIQSRRNAKLQPNP